MGGGGAFLRGDKGLRCGFVWYAVMTQFFFFFPPLFMFSAPRLVVMSFFLQPVALPFFFFFTATLPHLHGKVGKQ